jgi:PBP1b-binding outer membrane lipoprotein LpoB
VDASTQTDLSGYWNNTDVRVVCDSLISSCLDSANVTAITSKLGRPPRITIGNFRNQSDEHIDASIIASTMKEAIMESGKATFVASGDTRNQLRAEQQDQAENASDETAVSIGNEKGADFILIGTVKTIVDRAGNTSTRTYFVSAELTDLKTSDILWFKENSDVKKVIKRPGAKL